MVFPLLSIEFMSNIRHILRLHTQNQTMSEIVVQTGIHKQILKGIISDFKASKLTFSEINELTDADLAELFKKPTENPQSERLKTLYSLFPAIDKELKKKGVTKSLVYEEYKKKHPDGAGHSAFLFHFSQWKARVIPSMRQEHKAGDKLYIDFAGQKLSYTDKDTQQVKQVEVFVAILGASQLTYVEAMMTQKKEDFIPACENALHFYGGVPAAIVPDNLRSAVSKSHKYEPTINETFSDFAEHYNTTILPTRAYKPKDKALVESAIRIIYSRIYAKLRDQIFYSLEEINRAITLPLQEHNDQVLTGKTYSRRHQFEEIEKSTLLPLPEMRYEFKKVLFATVEKHGHVSLSPDKHYYSVPYCHIGKKVKVMFTRYKVEIYYEYERIALHKRWQTPYKYTTDKEHLPPTHRFVAELESEQILRRADEIHKDVKVLISKVLDSKSHPERAYKICLGILSFSKKVGEERLIMACQRALDYGIYNYKTIKKILDKGLEKDPEGVTKEQLDMPQHDNIRGSEYYK
jgi:transposase